MAKVKQLKSSEFSENRKRAIKEKEEQEAKLNLIGTPQRQLTSFTRK